MVTWRLLLEKSGLVYKKLGLPSVVVWYLRRAARSGLRSQGFGRHSEQEVSQMMEDDLQALSQVLGTSCPVMLAWKGMEETQHSYMLNGTNKETINK